MTTQAPAINLGDLPQDFSCPMCNAALPVGASMMGNEKPRIVKGMVVVCSHCSAVLILGDSKLVPMPKAQFERYPSSYRAFIRNLVLSVRHKTGNKGSQDLIEI